MDSGSRSYFARYVPQSFCREYVEIRGSSVQLSMFMSLVLGIKPLMDDWVDFTRLDDYLRMCRALGLHVRVDSAFLDIPREQVAAHVVGREALSSTIALGFPRGVAESGALDGLFAELGHRPTYHVFVSRERELLKRGMWYPLVVRGRIIWPPYIDVLKYGAVLGYPACCVRFFRERNDWARYSFLAEINRRSLGKPAHFLCNPLTKDCTYSYIYHMPCSWHCQATRALAQRLRQAIAAEEPQFVEEIDRHLLLPALVFYERKHYVFVGECVGPRALRYSQVFYPDGAPEGREYLGRLRAGDELELAEGRVRIFGSGRLLDEIVPRQEGFAPEEPFLVQFGRE